VKTVYMSQRRLALRSVLALSVVLALANCQPKRLLAEDWFEQHVAPILSQRCLACHSGNEPKGGFSMQSRDSFFAEGHVEPNDAASSHLIDLITPVDGTSAMPKDADPLTEDEVATIMRWINDGAEWPEGFSFSEAKVDDFDWWSYQPLTRPTVPESSDPWAKTPIDQFVLAKLDEKRLSHAPPADRRTLIRRLSYDLIGLPPTPEEVAEFVADTDPLAYEKAVDRLLASPRYGERWARHWLDVAKYADSCGYDKDKLRPSAWHYRDYVIRSLNDDKPYARFVQEQIAGDVLFPDDSDGIVALGFIAAGPWDFIGHAEVSESKLDGKVARNLDRDDMVSGVMNTFCSLTVQCARCHNHKFDPITQDHYYGLQAVFAAVDRAERPFDSDPVVAKRRREWSTRRNELISSRAAMEAKITEAAGQDLADVNATIAELEKLKAPFRPAEHGYHSEIESTPDIEKWVEIELPSESIAERIVVHACSDDFGGIGDGFGFPPRFKIEIADDSGEWKVIEDATGDDVSNPKLTALSFDLFDQKVRRVRVTATRLALRTNDFIFALAELEVFSSGMNVAAGARVEALDSIEAPPSWSRSNLVDSKWPRKMDADVEPKHAEATKRRDQILASATTPAWAKERTEVEEAIAHIESQLQQLPEPQMVYAAATSFKPEGNFQPTHGKPRDVRVLIRGEVSRPGEPALPGVVPLSETSEWQFGSELTESERRARLAEWLTEREHPLVWRSIVNRVWQYHFATGIVATPNDFGRMGAEPTHPELLDWLAVEFRDRGQSLKSLHRMIVLSNVYQQSSDDNAANSALDAGNQFLWRANRRRLSAEEIRDSILVASGAMNWKMGGPGYYLFELEKTDHSPHYEYHKFDPADRVSHRRSIYQFLARSQPNPYMTTLDCADSSQSTARRNETLTALQALALLNNKFNLVMAEEFAQRLEREADDPIAQVKKATLLIAQREASEGEAKEMADYARAHGLPNLCRMMFNLSEFVFVD
jgi:Protein of unknown function (DUF1553)/Protein of unknown function (DUF1549)/Planctomycete cytochrome C